MDMDFQDLDEIKTMAKNWNCDWLTLSRIDRSRRPGKILDLLDSIPLPISLTGKKSSQSMSLAIASSGWILDLALGVNTSQWIDSAQFGENS